MSRTTERLLVIDRPLTLSAKGGDYARYCKQRPVRSLADLQETGLIPHYVDLEALERAVKQALNPAASSAKKTRLARPLEADAQVEAVAKALDSKLPLSIRRNAASKAINLARTGGYTVTQFELDGDLEIRAALTFDESIHLAHSGEVVVQPGAVLEFQAPHFVLYARSMSGTISSPGAPGAAGIAGATGTNGVQGATGRDAVCRDIFHTDQVPTNGGAGSNGGAGGDGTDGGAGGWGKTFEAHFEVLLPGVSVNTSGGRGGDGGQGGQGGAGGKGGTGGNGNNCEPSGVGGKGGNGGPGGNGGNGGKGGNAGDIYIYYVSDQSAGNPPVLSAQGGSGGAGGQPGLGSDPGQPGNPGPESHYGNARWDPGKPGGPGATGANGSKGAPGNSGTNSKTVLEKVETV